MASDALSALRAKALAMFLTSLADPQIFHNRGEINLQLTTTFHFAF